MKTKFGFTLTEASGKLGGTVYTKNRWGSISKTKVTPANPQSARQSFVRNNQLIVTRAWSNLSDSQRSLWILESANHPQKDRFGHTHYLSGFGLFTKCNMNRLCFSESMLSAPGPFFQFPAWEVVSITAYSLNPSIYLFLKPSIPSGFAIVIYASFQLSAGITYCKGQYRLIGYLAHGQTFPVNLYSLYTAVFPDALYAGKRIFFKIALLNIASGFISNSSVIPVNISEGFLSTAFSSFSNLGRFNNQISILSLSFLSSSICLAGSGANANILRSTDSGASFSNLGQQFSQSQIWSLASDGNGIVIAGSGAGGLILRSTDWGASFSSLGQQFSQVDIRSLLYVGAGVFLAGTGPGGLILRSTDSGATWFSQGQLYTNTIVYSLAIDCNGVIFASVNSTCAVAISYDKGITFSKLVAISSETSCYSLCCLDNNIVLAGSAPLGHIYRSIDAGLTWVDLGQQFSQVGIRVFRYLGSGKVLAGTGNNGLILYSSDFGLTWSSLGQQFSQANIYSLAFNGSQVVVAGTASLGYVLRSTI